ncbi:MAG: sulfite exporter TauE/SafE family protein [Gammaproteobacteria bacterium]|nr:sulfite exporter TauE/SafE family protein [Gammaproteobacteria bacterium]
MSAYWTLLLTPGFAAAAAAVFVAGFLRGFVGFGGGIASVPVLSVVFGPLLAVPITTVMGMPALIQLLPESIRHGERAVLVPICVGVFLATPIGCFVLVSTNPQIMKIAISALVLLMVGMLACNWRPRGATTGISLAAGAASGLIHGAAGIGGPPLVAVALSRPGHAVQQRANVLGAVAAVSLATIFPLWYFDLYTTEVFVIGLVLVPVYSGSAWLGAKYFSQEGQRYYRTGALVILALIGVITLLIALNDYRSMLEP